MSWAQRYAVRSYLLSTVWISPLIAFVLEQLLLRTLTLEGWDPGWIPGFVFSPEGALAAADYVVSSATAFMVFTFGSLLVAIQVASGQLTPRIIATALLRNSPIRLSVGLFVFTLLIAVAVKIRADTIPHFLISLMGICGLLNILVFLFLIDYAARLLRPVSILVRIADRGLTVIEDVYPQRLADAPVPASPAGALGPVERTILQAHRSASVIAINLPALITAARRADCIIEVAPRVGDFVAVGEPLFRLRGPGASAINERVLRGLVAFGPERTIEQDSTFAFRVIVDIALKAMSKAINDPTTAVLAIDQLQRLLRRVAERDLRNERIPDADGRLRVLVPTPNWTDFVQLSVTEIRHTADNVQIFRRLRAMIDSLLATAPEPRRAALREELALLDQQVERVYTLPEDLALARTPDSQGMGGIARP